MGKSRTRALLVGLVLVALAIAPDASASTYSNPTPITMPVFGAGTPYPSTISVTGLPGNVVKATVALKRVSHTFPDDVDALLVGPGGQKVRLVDDQCGNGISALPFSGQTFTFDDAALTTLPDPGPCVPLETTWKPSPVGGNSLVGAAPPGPYSTALNALNAGPASGTWSLWIADDATNDSGTVAGGWSLDLLPSVSCGGRAATRAASVGTAGNDTLLGTSGDDVMLGLGGNDLIRGAAGRDTICGGLGRDVLVGGTGRDRLLGQAGNDKLLGLRGRDVCAGGSGHRDIAAGCEKEKGVEHTDSD